ncbi:hypothetical protein HanLR1_Chr00c2416g0843481 [Helianthus annuus]|nr:hypothetical protein HanLR1_Chr00c2416g0843481 [Helianthus annuus]
MYPPLKVLNLNSTSPRPPILNHVLREVQLKQILPNPLFRYQFGSERIRNEVFGERLGVACISDKIKDKSLR